MAKKRTAKKVPKPVKTGNVLARLRKELAKRTKDELIDALAELAGNDEVIQRRLAARFEVETPPKELIAATSLAISRATDFDERDMNRNFDYDSESYSEIKKNFGRLIALGQLRPAMELSVELMKDGSYQVEMSDEGMMTDDIEECLEVVVSALKTCDLEAKEINAWCDIMLKSDRVKFICDKELKALQGQVKASRTK